MTFLNIRDNVRSLVDETVATAVLTDTEVGRFVNNKYYEVVRIIMQIDPTYFGVVDSTIDLVADDDSYSLPDNDSSSVTRVEQLLHVKVAYDGTNFRRAQKLNITNIPDTQYESNVFTQDRPFFYLLGSTIYLLPTPSANATNGLKLIYSQRPAEMSGDTDVPTGISPLYHGFLAYGAAFDCVMKDRDPSEGGIAQRLLDEYRRGLGTFIDTLNRESTSPSTVNDVDGDDYGSEFYPAPGSLTTS